MPGRFRSTKDGPGSLGLLMNSEWREGLKDWSQSKVKGPRGVDPGAPMNLENELGKGGRQEGLLTWRGGSRGANELGE